MRYTHEQFMEDLAIVEKEQWPATLSATVQAILTSLKLLHDIAAESGKPIQNITGRDVIDEMRCQIAQAKRT